MIRTRDELNLFKELQKEEAVKKAPNKDDNTETFEEDDFVEDLQPQTVVKDKDVAEDADHIEERKDPVPASAPAGVVEMT